MFYCTFYTRKPRQVHQRWYRFRAGRITIDAACSCRSTCVVRRGTHHDACIRACVRREDIIILYKLLHILSTLVSSAERNFSREKYNFFSFPPRRYPVAAAAAFAKFRLIIMYARDANRFRRTESPMIEFSLPLFNIVMLFGSRGGGG